MPGQLIESPHLNLQVGFQLFAICRRGHPPQCSFQIPHWDIHRDFVPGYRKAGSAVQCDVHSSPTIPSQVRCDEQGRLSTIRKTFLPESLARRSEKPDQDRAVERVTINHPAYFTPVGNAGNHAGGKTLPSESDHRGLSLRGITATLLTVTAHAWFVPQWISTPSALAPCAITGYFTSIHSFTAFRFCSYARRVGFCGV